MADERRHARANVLAGLAVIGGASLALLLVVFTGRRRRKQNRMRGGWRIEAPKTSLTADIDDATLMLRLGIAVNALRAAQRFYIVTKDTPGPAGERDRFWSFLIAVGYLREAVLLIQFNQERIVTLAKAGGGTEDAIDEAVAIADGRTPFGKNIRRLRNKLIFHWDDDVIRQYVRKFDRDMVVWADGVGDTQGESIYRAAADAVSNCMLSDYPGLPDTPDENVKRVGELMRDVAQATGKITTVFDHAIIGHLQRHGAKQKPAP